jgi:prepilin-type processing-associated H-X9-DG protein
MSRAVAAVVILSLVASPLLAQPEVEERVNFDRMAHEQELEQRVQRFVEMGVEREAALFLTLLSESGMDPSQVLMMLMMAEHGGDEMIPLMLMNRGQGGSGAPAVVDRGDEVLIVENGTLYVIDMVNGEVKSKLNYAAPERLEDSPIFSLLVPMFIQGRGQAQQAACMSNLKQIGLAFMMYVADHDEVLPGEDWVEEVYPYLKNRQVFICPSREAILVGYAFNEALVGVNLADIEAPAETVLAFESNIGGDAPVGGADDVPPNGVHEGGVNVVFADAHVKWMPAEAAMDALAREVR